MNIRRILPVVAALLTLLGSAHAAPPVATPDVSGVYADEGTTVVGNPALFAGVASLHALLRLEFDPKLAALRHDQAAEIRITREGASLEFEVYDHEGAVSWRTLWRIGEGYSEQGRVLILRMRAERSATEEFFLLLEPVGSELLQIKVQRVQAGLFGPVVQSSGAYLFGRLR